MSDLARYDGRRPEPPHAPLNEGALVEAIEMLREVASEYRLMRLAFDLGDSRRAKCEELSDKVLAFIEQHE